MFVRQATCWRTRSVGALVVSPQGHIRRVQSVLPPQRRPIAITYASADEHLQAIRRLETPSLVAVVSVSSCFLEMARRLLAPAVGRRHSIREYLLGRDGRAAPRGTDFVVCDFLTYSLVRPRCRAGTIVIAYRLISNGCLDRIASVLDSRSGVSRSRMGVGLSRGPSSAVTVRSLALGSG
jgi:hypothetical protein